MKSSIADDHPVVRQGLRQMLAAESDLSVVGEAKNGQEVVELSRKVPWEVAVLDYNMPGKNGLELIKELRQRYPGRAVLILSMYPEDRYAVRALKAGAAGYLTKESAPEELVSAIRKVAGGGRYVTPTLGEKARARARGQPRQAAARDAFRPRIPGDVDDRLRKDRAADRRRAFPQPQHRQHSPHPHPPQDEHEVECGADALRDRASSRRLSCSQTTTAGRGLSRYPASCITPTIPFLVR
jgi:DNA-binding NarL/FixJ family response regulator